MNRRTFASLFAVLAAAPLALTVAFAAPVKGEKPQRIAYGKEVNLADYVVPGKTTVFDFTSHYCPPCEKIAPELDKLHAKRADIVVVAVDINRPDVKGIDWSSPTAKQFKLGSIPHFKVYGPDGKLVAEDTRENPKARQMVTKWFN